MGLKVRLQGVLFLVAAIQKKNDIGAAGCINTYCTGFAGVEAVWFAGSGSGLHVTDKLYCADFLKLLLKTQLTIPSLCRVPIA